MAANEMDNPLMRTQALLDVLERKKVRQLEFERKGDENSFEFLTDYINAGVGLARELAEERGQEKSIFPLRPSVVYLAAHYLRILELIDKQKDLGRQS